MKILIFSSGLTWKNLWQETVINLFLNQHIVIYRLTINNCIINYMNIMYLYCLFDSSCWINYNFILMRILMRKSVSFCSEKFHVFDLYHFIYIYIYINIDILY